MQVAVDYLTVLVDTSFYSSCSYASNLHKISYNWDESLVGRHSAETTTSPLAANQEDFFLSSAYVQRHITDEMRLDIGAEADTIVPYAVMGSYILGVHPYTLPRQVWDKEVAQHPATLMPLPESLASYVLEVGLSSGLLLEQPNGAYSIPNARVRAEMARLFHLYVTHGVSHLD